MGGLLLHVVEGALVLGEESLIGLDAGLVLLQPRPAGVGVEHDELFVELMREHHLGGVHMAEYAAEHAANDEVRAMATSMAKSQADEIAENLGCCSRIS